MVNSNDYLWNHCLVAVTRWRYFATHYNWHFF